MSRPGLEWGVCASFTKIIFKLTVDTSMRKIILEVEYRVKHDLLNVKIFQKSRLFHPEMILRPLFCFKDTKNTGWVY